MQKDVIYRQVAIDALDMAIERYDEMAEEYRKKADIERNDYMDTRDDAYEARQLAQWLNELKYLRGKIEQLTIKPEQRWIPCSERLPYAECGESDNVLTTCGYRNVEDRSVRWIRMLYFNGGNWCYPTGETYVGKVYAWMPLPEPYKGGDSE